MKCSKCGKDLGMRSSIYTTIDGAILCCHCVSDYTRCNECGLFFPRDGHYCCPNCDEKLFIRDLNSYGFKPRPYFKNKHGVDNKKERYYGLEIEFSNVNPTFVKANMLNLYKEKYIYNKSDSSLDDGVEIVTSPCDKHTIKWLLSQMRDTFNEIKSVRGHKNCAGIHIHVSKNSISPIDRYKLSYLLNIGKEAKSIYDMMYMLVGRKLTKDTRIDDHYFKIGQTDYSFKNRDRIGRYTAFNESNTNTLEFRLFKTTSDVDVILSYIEIVDKLIEFAHTHGIKDMKVQNFIVWLDKNTKNECVLKALRKIKRNYKYDKKITPILFKYNIDMIKGIHVDKYNKVLLALSNSKSVGEFATFIDKIKNDYRLGVSDIPNDYKKTELFNTIERTYKLVLANKIRKDIDLLCV